MNRARAATSVSLPRPPLPQFKKIRYGQDTHGVVPAQPEEVFIPGYDVIGASSRGAFQDSIIVRVLFHDIQAHGWPHLFSEALDFLPDLRDVLFRPAEFPAQHIGHLIEDGVRHGKAKFSRARQFRLWLRQGVLVRELLCDPTSGSRRPAVLQP